MAIDKIYSHPFCFLGNSFRIPLETKTLRVNDAQLAEKKFIALQYRSRAEIARSAILFELSGKGKSIDSVISVL